MIVNGTVTMSVTLNVIDLHTDAVEVDEYGRVRITNPDRFFVDWSEDWDQGIGELLGASDESVNLDADDADDADDEDEDDEDDEDRKPSAKIILGWDGDTYFYTLVVDGEEVLNAYRREECVREAERLGAYLEEGVSA